MNTILKIIVSVLLVEVSVILELIIRFGIAYLHLLGLL